MSNRPLQITMSDGNLMNRAMAALPWLWASSALPLAVLLVLTGDRLEVVGRVAVIVAGLATALVGWRVRRLPALFAIAIAAAGLRLGGVGTGMAALVPEGLAWQRAVPDLVVGTALMTMLALALRRRRRLLTGRDLVDVTMMAVGSGLATWIVLTNPLIDRFGTGPSLALAVTMYVPLSVMLLTFTVELLLEGLGRNRSMWMLLAAAMLNLAAGVVRGLGLVDVLGDGARALSLELFTAAFMCLCGAVGHADGSRVLAPNRMSPSGTRTARARLIALGGLSLAPAAMVAAVAPSSTVDIVVRTIGTIVLVIFALVRLVLTLEAGASAQETLSDRQHWDELTRLPNRMRILDCVADALERHWRTERRPSLMQLNIDRFKNINDSLGHSEANQVLVMIAERLRGAAAPYEGIVGRIGGDDFVVLDTTTTSIAQAEARAEQIRAALAAGFTIGDRTIFVTASVGLAVTPHKRTITADELMRRSDIATHRAKSDGRNRIATFDDSMQADLHRRMDVENALYGAIGRREMLLYHQPIVDVGTGRVNGFEALIRWQRQDGSLVPPNEFIPVAEETGVIDELGAWALLEALTQLRTWIDLGMVGPDTTMSVNVSPRQIADPHFGEIVQEALTRSNVPPHLLWIEVTESMMLDEPELALSTLRRIRAMGAGLALDDFGTGFSSLSLLQRFPIQRIKIDREFVDGIEDDDSLVRTIIAMGRTMGLDVVAEGVETIHQLQALRDLGCERAQGFLISRPVPADAMRSTMVALHELASLSMFQRDDGEPEASGPDPRDDEPTCLRHHEPLTHTAMHVVGQTLSRPLGQPFL